MGKTVMVLGAGFMGSGIAQVSAAAGHKVLLWDIKEEFVQGGVGRITKSLDGRIAKGKMTEETKADILSRIVPTVDLNMAAEADIVMEAVVENKEVKQDLFAKVDKIAPVETVLASNTSSIPISSIANALEHKERFMGLHFFSPVPAMKLVEMIRGMKTSQETMDKGKEFVDSIGKTGVTVKDSPGFLVNRINHALRGEAFRCLQDGIATMEDIDTAMKMGLGHPMGPFELNDMSGLDISLAVFDTLYENFKDPKWVPILAMRKLVEAGECGRKSGKGWYDYTSGEKKPRTDINL